MLIHAYIQLEVRFKTKFRGYKGVNRNTFHYTIGLRSTHALGEVRYAH